MVQAPESLRLIADVLIHQTFISSQNAVPTMAEEAFVIDWPKGDSEQKGVSYSVVLQISCLFSTLF
jgi:hypothetical protein